MTTEIRNVTLTKLHKGSVMGLVETLEAQHPKKPTTTMKERRSPSTIMLPIIKKAGLL